MKGRFVFAVVALLLFFSTPAVAKEYHRIVSLGPTITEELYQLGAGDRVVGCTIYCKRKEAASKPRVAKAIEVDLEKVVALKPDLVLATSLTDLRAIKKLREMGLKVVVFHYPRNFSEICSQFMEIARLVGREEQAREIINRTKSQIEEIARSVKGLKKPKVFVEIGARPLFTATKDSFIDQLVALAGGMNIVKTGGSGIYSREAVIKENPHVIIITTMGITAEEKKAWERFKSMRAVKEKRIYVMDSYKLCTPTPITFVEALKEMVEILHPGKAHWERG